MTNRQKQNGRVMSCLVSCLSSPIKTHHFPLQTAGLKASALRGENDFKEQQGKERGEEGGQGNLEVTKQLTRTDNTCTEEEFSMDSEANSPKEPKKLPEKETKMQSKPTEQPRGLESLKAAEEKRVVKVQKVARSGLVSVSETLDRAMQQLQESLEDGDTGGRN